MNNIIDLGNEWLIDRTEVRLPHLRLLLAAIAKPLVRGSAWVIVNKQLAALYSLNREFSAAGRSNVTAA